MPVSIGREVLYFNRVVRSTGASSGVNYGILCITHQSLYYVSKKAVELHNQGALSGTYAVNQQENASYDGIPLEDIVPSLATHTENLSDFDRSMEEMAQKIDGSVVIPVAEIDRCKIGYFAQLTLFSGNDKHKFTIGGKEHREQARRFLSEQLGLA